MSEFDVKRFELEQKKLEIEEHKNARDEQFWFTAATLTINGLFITKGDEPWWIAIPVSALISLFAVHLILARWVSDAKIKPEGESDATKDTVSHRWQYTRKQIWKSINSLPWVFAELSGGAFYVTVILLSCIGVIFKYFNFGSMHP